MEGRRQQSWYVFGERRGEKDQKNGGPWNLKNTNPFSFHKMKASCLLDLTLELFDVESIQLLGGHID